jgi:hypothetical protein
MSKRYVVKRPFTFWPLNLPNPDKREVMANSTFVVEDEDNPHLLFEELLAISPHTFESLVKGRWIVEA